MVLFILFLLTAVSTSARVIHVPADQATLADAFAILESNDTVYVQPGEYSGVGFEGLELSGPEWTQDLQALIACENEQSQVHIAISDDSTFLKLLYCYNVELRNFVFEGGYQAIWCSYAAHATIVDCIFDSCLIGIRADAHWTSGSVSKSVFTGNEYGMYLEDEAGWTLNGCVFHDLETGIRTGYTPNPRLTDCVFYNCVFALDIHGATLYMKQCTIYHCYIALMGYSWYREIENNLIAWNGVGIAHAYEYDYDTYLDMSCNNVWGNYVNYSQMPDLADSLGNISVDPLLCDSTMPDSVNPLMFPLAVNPLSPCLPENNDCGVNMGNVYVACNCCRGVRGNVDYDLAGLVDVADLTKMINSLFITFEAPLCEGEADIDLDGSVDIGDLTRLINHLFITFEALPVCE